MWNPATVTPRHNTIVIALDYNNKTSILWWDGDNQQWMKGRRKVYAPYLWTEYPK